jgi:hypothetical protein
MAAGCKGDLINSRGRIEGTPDVSPSELGVDESRIVQRQRIVNPRETLEERFKNGLVIVIDVIDYRLVVLCLHYSVRSALPCTT